MKRGIPYILGIICGYIITLEVFSELIPILLGTDSPLYTIVVYGTLVASMIFCTLIFQLIVERKVNRELFIMIFIAYFLFLIVVLFTKISVGRILVLNPAVGIIDAVTNKEMLAQSILNLVVFIPMGYFFRGSSRMKTLLSALCIATIIEIVQYVFMVGFCDTFDIILYTIGIVIGRTVFNCFKVEVMERVW